MDCSKKISNLGLTIIIKTYSHFIHTYSYSSQMTNYEMNQYTSMHAQNSPNFNSN